MSRPTNLTSEQVEREDRLFRLMCWAGVGITDSPTATAFKRYILQGDGNPYSIVGMMCEAHEQWQRQ